MELVDESFKQFLYLDPDSLCQQRLYSQTKYQSLETDISPELQLITSTLRELQICREMYEDGILILSKLSAPAITLNQIHISLEHLLKALQNQIKIQTSLLDYCEKCSADNDIKQESFQKIKQTSRKTSIDVPISVVQPTKEICDNEEEYHAVIKAAFHDGDQQGGLSEEEGLSKHLVQNHFISQHLMQEELKHQEDKIGDFDGFPPGGDSFLQPPDEAQPSLSFTDGSLCPTFLPQFSTCEKLSSEVTNQDDNAELLDQQLLQKQDDLSSVKLINFDEVSSQTQLVIKVEMDQTVRTKDKKVDKCDLCQKSIKHNCSLTNHRKRSQVKTEGKDNSCDDGGLDKFVVSDQSVKHSKILLASAPSRTAVKCDQCFKEFGSKGALNTHMRVHTGERPYSCEQCDKSFSHKGHLKDHLHVHSGQKPFQCDFCPMSFARLRSKMSHMTNHLEDKPFKCDICNKGFGIKRVLTKHMRTHTGEKAFKCAECNKCFVSNFVLKVHMRKHTGERPYKCDQCFKMFTQNSSLTDHMRIHTGEKPYKCDQCFKEFTTKSILRKHLLSHGGKS